MHLCKRVKKISPKKEHSKHSKREWQEYQGRWSPSCQHAVCASCSVARRPLQKRPETWRERCDPAGFQRGPLHNRPSGSTPSPARRHKDTQKNKNKKNAVIKILQCFQYFLHIFASDVVNPQIKKIKIKSWPNSACLEKVGSLANQGAAVLYNTFHSILTLIFN